MTYYKVKPEYDNKLRFVWKRGKAIPDSILIGHELYTPTEFEKIANYAAWFEKVQVSKKKTYFSFGARFESSK